MYSSQAFHLDTWEKSLSTSGTMGDHQLQRVSGNILLTTLSSSPAPISFLWRNYTQHLGRKPNCFGIYLYAHCNWVCSYDLKSPTMSPTTELHCESSRTLLHREREMDLWLLVITQILVIPSDDPFDNTDICVNTSNHFSLSVFMPKVWPLSSSLANSRRVSPSKHLLQSCASLEQSNVIF